MMKFGYRKPADLQETFDLLEKGDAKILAGGTDLIPRLKKGLIKTGAVIDIRGVPELARIEEKNGAIRIGPLATHNDIVESPLLREKAPILPEAAMTMAGPQIRNMGTIGGNICNASPAGDLLPALLCLHADFQITSRNGERLIRAANFFLGPGTTAMETGEILTDIIIPIPHPKTVGVYLKKGRRQAMEIAQVSVACILRMNEVIEEIRIALGAVASTPVRARRAEGILLDSAGDEETINTAAELACKACAPIDDVRTTAEYRAEMVKVLTRRAVTRAIKEARSR